MAQSVQFKLPAIDEWLLSIPLYKPFAVPTAFFANSLPQIEFFDGVLDCYCEGCERHSVFKCQGSDHNHGEMREYHNHVFTLRFECTREWSHQLNFLFLADKGTLQKIGQYPSMADLAEPDLRKYRKLLGVERYGELVRGIGLVSHGVGIGAFVYLRRIFESLIDQAHGKAAEEEVGWEEADYEKARMEQKIALLKAYLPPFLVESRKLYGILSVGIHELSEDKCLEAFPVVKLGIEMILDQELERVNREEKIKAAQRQIAALSGKLKKE